MSLVQVEAVRANPLKSESKMKIKRICAGYYEIAKEGRTGTIAQFNESAEWNGWWMVRWTNGDYSDPVRTYREAKLAATLWEF